MDEYKYQHFKMMSAKTFSGLTALSVRQKGLVLIVTLLALTILLLASVALIRSTDTNLQIAGNMAFKRDIMNQAERAIPTIEKMFVSGALSDTSTRYSNSVGNNYYATIQPNNASGIPDLLSKVTQKKIAGDGGVEVSYIIDRMCLATGEVKEGKCMLAGSSKPPGGGNPKEIGDLYTVYRITVRATGPKNTEAYMQATFSDR